MKREHFGRPQDLTATQPISQDVLKEKYLKPGESGVEDVYRRVARALASVELPAERAKYEALFLENLHAGAIGAGRIMSAAGTDIQATLINCFVQPVGDCIQGVDSGGFPGIYEALREAAETMRRGGGVGYDFSRIRPRGAEVKAMASMASGPCSYINVFDQSCATVESAGARRGAQMGVLRIDHPDVHEFITAKRTPGRWNNFNVSVGVSDAFMQALAEDGPWELIHQEKPGAALLAQGAFQRADGQWVYQTVAARELWDTVMRSAYDFAEPGILFLDHINQDNNLRYCESIAATNPCVTADTWVMTAEGPMHVADLVGRRFTAVVNGQAYPVESEGFFKTGRKPVLALKTREGHSLRLTADHRVRRVAHQTRYLLQTEWVAAGQLRPGDEIVLNNHRAMGGWDGAGTESEGYLRAVATPEAEKKSSAFTIGLLRGLLDAQGAVRESPEKGPSLHLLKSDLYRLQAVQRMLLRLGVASRIEPNRPDVQEMSPGGHGALKLYDINASHELTISGDNLRVYAERIGFSEPAKATRLAQVLASHSLNRERFTVTVESLAQGGVEDVFDVTVADIHAFDANGFYVHNCGEQPLPPYGCCDLGPIILTRFVRHPFGVDGEPSFDFEAFEASVATQVRALDNVLEVTFWPLPQQQAESAAKRRIGVGFTGLGNALAMLCLRYDAPDGRDMAARIAVRLRDAAYAASVALAQEKGAFPKFDADGYLASGTFASRLPPALQQLIRAHGIRNSHLLSIAPTGTVSLAFADNASNGIEPPFSWMYRRHKREADGSRTEYAVEDHAWRLYRELGGDVNALPDYFVSALQMTASSHIAMMEAVQPFIDTAISKTVNVPVECAYDDFKSLYHQAWRARLKGLATYRPNAILGAVLQTHASPETASSPATGAAAAPPVDPMRTVIESRPKGALSAIVEKVEYWTQEGHQRLYLVVSFLPVPAASGSGTVERAIEFFMPVGQSGASQQWITASMRLLSLAARGGFLERALSDMRKVAWDRGPVRLGTYEKADGTHVPMWHDSEVAAIAYALQHLIARRASQPGASAPLPEPTAAQAVEAGLAPPVMAGKKCGECGAHAVIRKDGCDYCTQCGQLGTCG